MNEMLPPLFDEAAAQRRAAEQQAASAQLAGQLNAMNAGPKGSGSVQDVMGIVNSLKKPAAPAAQTPPPAGPLGPVVPANWDLAGQGTSPLGPVLPSNVTDSMTFAVPGASAWNSGSLPPISPEPMQFTPPEAQARRAAQTQQNQAEKENLDAMNRAPKGASSVGEILSLI